MKLLRNRILFCLLLVLGLSQALHLTQMRREANAAPEPAPAPIPAPETDIEPAPKPAPVPVPELDLELKTDTGDVDEFESGESKEEETETTTLGIVSIKSRVIAKDRALCLQLSPYHPHYPKCHDYCKRLDHWIGQCWKESCHCIS